MVGEACGLGRSETGAATRPRGPAPTDALAALGFLHSPGPLLVLDADGLVVDANLAFARLVDRRREVLLGRPISDFSHPDDAVAALAIHSQALSGGRSCAYAHRYSRPSGVLVPTECDVVAAAGDDGRALLVVTARDVTGEEEIAAELEFQAYHDVLTGLANRALFEGRLAEALDACESGAHAALLLLDLDDFKAVNDTLGHGIGDELLVAFAERLRHATRAADTLCRFGGDEFLVLVEGLSGPEEADEIAGRILQACSSPFKLGSFTVVQKASIGVVPLERGGGDARRVLEYADTAMYEAKRLGKGRRVVFEPAVHERAVERFELARDLAHAISRGELAMHYQPLVDIASGTVLGFEALMRWTHPQRGLVPPSVFIEIAEQGDLIFELGAFALREATRAVMSWTLATGPSSAPYVSVNLSARQLRDPGLVRVVEEALTASGLGPDRLVLEVTESVALVEGDSSADTLRRLAERGVRIAIDDFGTGYSSLSYLPKMVPSMIKIDRSFVAGFCEDADRAAVLESVVGLGHTLNATVVAEGVETLSELDGLRRLGCEVGQGFLFSPPLPPEEIPVALERMGSVLACLSSAGGEPRDGHH